MQYGHKTLRKRENDKQVIKRIYIHLDLQVQGNRQECYIEHKDNYMNYILVFAKNLFIVKINTQNISYQIGFGV